MTELTTGVLLLVSSLYGSGQADGHVANISTASTDHEQEIAEQYRNEALTTTDPIVMEKYLRNEFANDPILVEIARCESNFRQFDKDGDLVLGMVDKADVGVMQINKRYHAETAKKLGLDLHSVEGNVAYAKYLYAKEGTKPWSASKKCWSIGNTVAMR